MLTMMRVSKSESVPTHRALRSTLLGAICAFSLLVGAGSAWAIPISDFVISEVMYEPTGSDNDRQWVELYNGTGGDIDLSNHHLEWGRNGLSDSVGLSGTLLTGSTWVIGGPTSDGNNGNPIFDQVFNFNPNLGDGGHPWREDGLALFETATSTMLHTVVYGGNGNNPPYVDEQGNPAIAIDDSALTAGQSLEYLGSDVWLIQSTTTPGTPNPSLVPEPTPAILIALGLIALGSRRRLNGLGLHARPARRIVAI